MARSRKKRAALKRARDKVAPGCPVRRVGGTLQGRNGGAGLPVAAMGKNGHVAGRFEEGLKVW